MEGPVTRIIILAASIAVTALVVGVVWAVVQDNAPDTGDPAVDNLGQITDETLCDLAGGTWTAADTPPCSG